MRLLRAGQGKCGYDERPLLAGKEGQPSQVDRGTASPVPPLLGTAGNKSGSSSPACLPEARLGRRHRDCCSGTRHQLIPRPPPRRRGIHSLISPLLSQRTQQVKGKLRVPPPDSTCKAASSHPCLQPQHRLGQEPGAGVWAAMTLFYTLKRSMSASLFVFPYYCWKKIIK